MHVSGIWERDTGTEEEPGKARRAEEKPLDTHSVCDGPRRAKQGLASHQASLRGLQLRPILGQGKEQPSLYGRPFVCSTTTLGAKKPNFVSACMKFPG